MNHVAPQDLPWDEIGLREDPAIAAPMLQVLPGDEVVLRLTQFAAWASATGARSGVHVVLTPMLVRFLSSADHPAFTELDALVDDTRGGRFDPGNELQRDLEFGRFQVEYRRLRNRPAGEDPYALFTGLDRLPLPELEWRPSEVDLLAVERAAHEAVGFLAFLRQLRRGTSRPIVVVGNDKGQLLGGGYGRLWVVEPLEQFLPGVEVVYPRVTSHATMRLNTPSPFSGQFIERLCAEMPHVVVVDGAGASRLEGATRFSRAHRGYANWFALFNELRTGTASEFPTADHVGELRNWHEYRIVREGIARAVSPGAGYTSAFWAADPAATALLGEVLTPWRTALPGDEPQVVHANPIIYRSDLDGGGRQILPAGDLPNCIAQTSPYYLDSVDKRLRAAFFVDGPVTLADWGDVDDNPVGPVGGLNPVHTIYGFGPHGFERRAVGPSLARCVSVFQALIREKIGNLV